MLPNLWRLFEHWEQFPPAHLLLKGFVGYKPKPKPVKSDSPDKREELARVFQLLGGQVVRGKNNA